MSGETRQMSDFQGQKRMVWLFATWCPSCKQGARALQNNLDRLGDMRIIGVKTAGNAGYEGPSVRAFVESFAPSLLECHVARATRLEVRQRASCMMECGANRQPKFHS